MMIPTDTTLVSFVHFKASRLWEVQMGVVFQMVELGSVGLGYTLIMGVKNISIHIQYVVMLL